MAICEFKLELRSGNAQIGGKMCFILCNADLLPMTLTFWIDFTSVSGNYSWKFCDDTMRETLWDGQTDAQSRS